MTNDLEIQDTTGLTDADWAEINKLREAHKNGRKALAIAVEQLAKDPVRYAVVIGAFFPDMVREAIKDGMAEMFASFYEKLKRNCAGTSRVRPSGNSKSESRRLGRASSFR